MAELTTVARPYAEAAFRAAVEAGQVSVFGDRLQVLGTVAAHAQMISLLGNPNVAAKQKVELLASLAGGEINGEMPAPVTSLLAMLIENGKTRLLPFIAEHFQRLQRAHEGVIKVTVSSAFPLSEADQASLATTLGKKYGKRVEMEVKVDESLIGGVRVQVGDEVVHASVRDMLNQMAASLVH